MISWVEVGGLLNEMRSGPESNDDELCFLWEEGGGARSDPAGLPVDPPPPGRGRLNWKSYFACWDSVSFIDDALTTESFFLVKYKLYHF